MASLTLCAFLVLVAGAAGHSYLVDPQPIRQGACRLGNGGTCSGPCNADYKTWTWTNYSPATGETAKTFQRGQTYNVKYTRNNHTPGGFMRLTIVPMDKVMDKKAHAEGAFHYSCWGAGFKVATEAEKTKDSKNFNFIGDDGLTHDYPPGYYSTDVTIPTNVPDGTYMMGWVWYGGIGGGASSIRNTPQDGLDKSFFADYWSCSYIQISGGAPLQSSYTPVFKNTKPEFSYEGCKTAASRIGECTYEPCPGTPAWYGVPEEFEGGKTPPAIPSSFYGGAAPAADPVTEAPAPTIAATQPVTPAPATNAPPAPPAAAPPAAPTTTPPTAPAAAAAAAPAAMNSPSGMYLEVVDVTGSATDAGRRVHNNGVICPDDYEWGFSIVCRGVPAGATTVKFFDNNVELRTEYSAPYTINGDKDGKANRWMAYRMGGAKLIKCVADTGERAEANINFKC